MMRCDPSTVMIASAAIPRIPENFASDSRSASSTCCPERSRASTMTCRIRTRTRTALTMTSAIDRSILHEESQSKRELDVVGPMRQPELLLNALLVCVDRLRTDIQLLSDLWRRVPLRHEAKHVSFTLRQLVELLAFRLRRILLRQVLRQHSAGARIDVDVAVRHGTDRVDELAIGRALHEITCRSGFHERDQIILFSVHRQDEDAGRQSLCYNLLRCRSAVHLRHRQIHDD